MNPKEPSADGEITDSQEAARAKGVQLHVVKASSEGEIEPAFVTLSQLRAGALVVVSSVLGPILTEVFGKRLAAKIDKTIPSTPRADLFPGEPILAGAGQESGV